MELQDINLQKVKNKNHIKRIAILTSGGDSPGMNAAIRAVTRAALSRKLVVFGIDEGYRGLKEGRFRKLTAGSVGDILQRGGTILRTARLDAFRTDKAVRDQCYASLKQHKIDALVVLGGDGSFQGANLLASEHTDLRVVGLPCTIDNDLAYTDFTIGFDTAVNTCVHLINNLRDTMASHDRISVVEVMGRYCGDIAIYAGIAAGAEAILIPEKDTSDNAWLQYIYDKLNKARTRKKEYGIIVMAEGMHLMPGKTPTFTAEYVSRQINQYVAPDGYRFDSRSVDFAHVQRGGSPSASDRVLASTLGYHAVKVLLAGENCHCVGVQRNRVYDEDISTAVATARVPRLDLIDIADVLAR